MEDGDDYQQLFKPIRRVNQACNFCRRRKARCSGHRPCCVNCRRLSLECVYDSSNPPQPDKSKFQPTEHTNEFSTTLASLKVDISLLQAQIQSIFESQQHILALLSPQSSRYSRSATSSVDLTEHGDSSDLEQSWNESVETEPSQNEMFSRMIRSPFIEQLVDIYFECCHNQPYSLFHERNFRRCLAAQEIPDHLLLAIVATSLRFSDHTALKCNATEIATEAVTRSWGIIGSVHLSNTKNTDIRVAQTLTLLSIFDFTGGKQRHGSAWIKIGIAIRLAQEMKLMHHPPSELSFECQEERRRVFWSLYLVDRLASCGRGRPCSIPDSCCQLQLPCDELSWQHSKPKSTGTLSQFAERRLSPLAPQSPYALLLLLANLLGRATHCMLQQTDENNPVPPWDHRSDFAATQSSLMYLEQSFSLQEHLEQTLLEQSALQGHIDQSTLGPVVFSQILFHLCYCMLYHPFLLKNKLKDFQGLSLSSFLSRNIHTAYEHSKQLILCIHTARSMNCRADSSFFSYAAVFAGSILALFENSTSQRVRSETNSLQRTNIEYLEDHCQRWTSTHTAVSLLKNLIINLGKRSPSAYNGGEHQPLQTTDAELLWTLLDYSAWSNLSTQDVDTFSPGQATNNWPDMDPTLDDICSPLPLFDF